MKKVTAIDVAKVTGVSTAAVSRAFREGSSLKTHIREVILQASQEMGYSPPAVRSTSSIQGKTITLVIGDLNNPFYPKVAETFSQTIHARGDRMILHAVPPGGNVDLILEQVLDHRSDAAIVTSSLMSSQIAIECRRRSMPVILFNRIQPGQKVTAVTCDNYRGGRLAAKSLISKGYRNMALIGGRRNTSTHIERARGFKDGVKAAGLTVAFSTEGNFEYEQSFSVINKLLTSSTRLDAIFCLNDIMALAAMDAARHMGMQVPGDVAVIGFDDIPMASWPSYELTTVRQPLEIMIPEALELIDKQITNPAAEGVVRIAPVTIIERSSA